MKKAWSAVSLAICSALIFTAALCSCSAKEEEKPANGGVPDRVVSRPAQPDGAPEESPQITGVSDDSVPAAAETPEESAISSETTASQTDAPPEDGGKPNADLNGDDIVIEENDISDCMAMKYLKLLNSGKVHASLIEASSHDNENASSIEREYFVNGNNAVFINGSTKIIMDDTEVTVVDLDEMTCYSYPREDEDTGANFGYDISDYSLVSRTEDEDGSLTEVYEIAGSGGNIKSTWTFFPGGNLTVADVTRSGAYYWYSFSIIESDVSGMDMSVPEGVIETEPEDFFE